MRRVIARIRDWRTLTAVELVEQLLREVPASEVGSIDELEEIVEAFPREGCRLIRLVLDKSLDAYLASGGKRVYRGLLGDMSLDNSMFHRALKAASTAEPSDFVEALLPWLQRAVSLTDSPDDELPYFTPDVLSHGWYDGLDAAQDSFIQTITDALNTLARTQPDRFQAVAGRLAAIPYQTPQQLLAHVYREVPDAYAEDVLRFLLDDSRRLNLGDHQQYDSRRLVSAIYPFLSEGQRSELEAYIVSWNLILRDRGLQGLRWRGLEQLYLLQAIPPEYLSDRAARYLAELERKFPGIRAPEAPLKTEVQTIGSPIDEDAHARMSDEAWLCAMRKYHGDVRHLEWHRGGACQLAGRLQHQVKEEPERFYKLAMRVPDDVDDEYATAFINGLAEAEAPAEWLFEVVGRFGRAPARDIKRTVAWALEQRSGEGLSDDMIRLLEDVVRGPMGGDEARAERDGNDPFGAYLNSDRGASMRTLMRVLDSRGDDGDRERMWTLVEYTSVDPSAALHAGAIEQLLYRLLTENRERAVTLFERLMDGHPELLCAHDTAEFLHYGSFQHFSRTRPFVQAMMDSEKDDCSQTGAQLACVSAISSPGVLGSAEDLAGARALAECAVTGRAAMRRGATKVYAYNMDSQKSAFCARELFRLMEDEDTEVRRLIAEAFSRMRSVRDPEVRRFVEEFAASRALADGENAFAEFLWEYGLDDPSWALSIVETMLDNRHLREPLRRTGGEELVRLVLRVYTDPTTDATLQERAMDAFDKLMERYAYEAQRTLEEWDRR